MAAVRRLGFLNVWNFNCWFGGPICVIVPYVVQIGQTVAEISQFFGYFRMTAAAILDFLNFKSVKVLTVKRVELRHRVKFRRNRCDHGRDITICRIFKMAAAAILDFWKYKFLTVGRVMSVELRHFAIFCRNRSNCGEDMPVFDFIWWRLLPCWICEIWNF